MSKRTIKWQRFQNPLVDVNLDDEQEEGRVMVRSTPFGVEAYQVNKSFPKEKVFVGHTNFDIDDEVKFILDNTEGVEVLEVFSAYRMKITVGKAFSSSKVKSTIEQRLCQSDDEFDFDDDVNADIYKESSRLRREDKPWFMYILPNGGYETCQCDSGEELEKKLLTYQKIRNAVGGVLLFD